MKSIMLCLGLLLTNLSYAKISVNYRPAFNKERSLLCKSVDILFRENVTHKVLDMETCINGSEIITDSFKDIYLVGGELNFKTQGRSEIQIVCTLGYKNDPTFDNIIHNVVCD